MDNSKLSTLLIPVTIKIKQAMRILNETAEKILFVGDELDRCVGTLTDGDIRNGIINGIELNSQVKDIMQKDFIAVKSCTHEIETQAKRLMIENKIGQIPVVDDLGKITDVVLWDDILAGEEQAQHKKLLPNHVVIMAGGKGTRLDPFTKILPKPLIPIGSKPIIEIIMERFHHHGFHKFIYTLNYKKEYLKLFLRENNFSYTIDWVEEDDFSGTAGSLSLIKDKVSDTFIVTNCDSLMEVNFEDILDWHKENNAAITIIGCHNEVKIPFGVIEFSDGKLKNIVEKPTQDIFVNTGVYVMEPHVISYLPEDKQVDMNTLIELCSAQEKVVVYPIYGGWLDVGQWDEYKKSLNQICEGDS